MVIWFFFFPISCYHIAPQLYFLCGEVFLLLFLIVNLPTTSIYLSWVGGLPFCKQTWLFHHFCWAIIDNLIPHLSPLSLIKCLISHYLPPNFWLCKIPQAIFPQPVGLCSSPPQKTPLQPLGCQDLLLALLSPWFIPFCLEFGMTATFRKHPLAFHWIQTLSPF